MTFGVGDLVECVDDSDRGVGGGAVWERPVVRGNVYTVREVGLTCWTDGGPAIRLAEVYREPYDSPLDARRFRPFRSKHIEALRKIVADVFDGVRA